METIKYYIDSGGNYLGMFVNTDGPSGAIEVSGPPDHAWQIYDTDNGVWLPLTAEQQAMVDGS